jgi:hypothetical protein
MEYSIKANTTWLPFVEYSWYSSAQNLVFRQVFSVASKDFMLSNKISKTPDEASVSVVIAVGANSPKGCAPLRDFFVAIVFRSYLRTSVLCCLCEASVRYTWIGFSLYSIRQSSKFFSKTHLTKTKKTF